MLYDDGVNIINKLLLFLREKRVFKIGERVVLCYGFPWDELPPGDMFDTAYYHKVGTK